LIGAMLDHLSDHPEIDPERYTEHTAAVLVDGIAEPTHRLAPRA
jgi:hypothetical protein